jgi:DNA-binding NarL/FixJ family response regulator
MVVDDSATFREAARALVEACDGFVLVGQAASGEEALATVQRVLPDLVLLDVNLPGISGTETCRLLTQADPHLSVVLVSSDDLDPLAMRECLPSAFIRKADLSPRVLRSLCDPGRP